MYKSQHGHARKTKVTTRDIASSLNVSISTVSRALNPKTASLVSTERVQQIKIKAREMGFMPNLSAAALRTHRTNTIGVLIPDLLNPIFPPMLKGIQSCLCEQDNMPIVIYTNNDQQEAVKGVQNLIARQVDGLIMANAFLDDESVYEALRQEVPCVMVSRSIADGHIVHQVLNDDFYGIQLAIEYLLSLGHRHIVHLAGAQDILHGKKRREAFEWLSEKNEVRYDVVGESSDATLGVFSIDSGQESMRAYLTQGGQATAVIAANDLMALGAMKVLESKGISVPEDISIIGYNDMPYVDFMNPPLTTIEVPHQLLGEHGALLLLREVAEPYDKKHRMKLSPSIKIRQSCTPPKQV